MTLTKEKALRICRELWMWMYRTEADSFMQKSKWPGWKRYGEMLYSSSCCEYNRQKKRTCDRCLLFELWNPLIIHDYIIFPDRTCVYSFRSPYRKFEHGTGTQEDSIKIIRGCEAALRKLGHKVPTYRPRRKKK